MVITCMRLKRLFRAYFACELQAWFDYGLKRQPFKVLGLKYCLLALGLTLDNTLCKLCSFKWKMEWLNEVKPSSQVHRYF